MSCLHIKIEKCNKGIDSKTHINKPLDFKVKINSPYGFRIIEVPAGLNIKCEIINTEDF